MYAHDNQGLTSPELRLQSEKFEQEEQSLMVSWSLMWHCKHKLKVKKKMQL